MGFATSWLAVRNKSALAVLADIGLQRTGTRDYVPDAPLSCADLPGGWFVIFAKDIGFVDNLPLARLSMSADVVTCVVEEHVMFSFAAAWNNGERQWAVTHDASEGLYHLKAEGKPPAAYREIRGQAEAAQKKAGGENSEVDYIFDVPVGLARTIRGFRHDKTLDNSRLISETLR